MPCDEMKLTRRGAVAVLTMDRPSRRNALNGPMWEALAELPAQLADDPPRALIVHGAGDHFSAGMDLSMDNPLLARLAPAAAEHDDAALHALVLELKEAVGVLTHLPFPTIAAIEGACVGGALEVALACDLRVASDTAFFGMPELQVGMAPDVGGTVRLTRLVGHARATDMILTGRQLDADTALDWGLVNRLAPGGQALAWALEVADSVRGSAPRATEYVLPVLRHTAGEDDDAAFQRETRAGVHTLMGGEFMEGAMAFMEKRRPSWAEDEA